MGFINQLTTGGPHIVQVCGKEASWVYHGYIICLVGFISVLLSEYVFGFTAWRPWQEGFFTLRMMAQYLETWSLLENHVEFPAFHVFFAVQKCIESLISS